MSQLQVGQLKDYADIFSGFTNGLNGQACSYVHQIRQKAYNDFVKNGLLSAKIEDWKYTKNSIFNQIMKPHIKSDQLCSEETRQFVQDNNHNNSEHHLVLVNGFFNAALSKVSGLPKGVVMGSLSQAFVTHPQCIQRYLGQVGRNNDALVLLNTAFVLDGIFIYLPKGTVIEKPVYIASVSETQKSANNFFSRIVIVAEANSSVSIVVNHNAACGVNFNHSLTEVVLGDNAKCDMSLTSSAAPEVLVINNLNVLQNRDSNFKLNSFNFASKLSRNDTKIVLDEKGASCSLTSLSLAKANEQADDVLDVHHQSPLCTSEQLYKGIFTDKALGTFYGKIKVSKDAIKTAASQSSRSLLLSPTAACNARPQLEIDTDDVACTHGSTVGQLDETALFFLQARGIEANSARNMLTLAFAEQAIDKIKIPELKERIKKEVSNWLESGDGKYEKR
ncbi:MAG: Fe-S cluster assembly protein SufD [bacterium]|nr:Fe-S cluster assembly protein SufD [bacterium]